LRFKDSTAKTGDMDVGHVAVLSQQEAVVAFRYLSYKALHQLLVASRRLPAAGSWRLMNRGDTEGTEN